LISIIGVAGGSGSGKTTFARALTDKLGRENVTVLAQDSYYIDRSSDFDRDGGRVNFDDPNSIDWGLMEQHLKLLRKGAGVDIPIYEFATHKRQSHTMRMEPKKYLIVDGILIYVHDAIRTLIDEKIFIEAPELVRFERRLKRDVVERGRTPDGVRAQFFGQVKPMHDKFVEPSRFHATEVINSEHEFGPDIHRVAEKLFKL
jgi:uridine kinase